MNKTDELTPLSRKKKFACNLSAAGIIILAGLFLLFCGVGLIPVPVSKAAAGVLTFSAGLILLVTALVQRNGVAMWLSVLFFMPAIVELIEKVSPASYANLYPIYISAPAFSSLFTALLTREWRIHLPVILAFLPPAIALTLCSSGLTTLSVGLPILVIYLGCLMLFIALKRRKKDEDEL